MKCHYEILEVSIEADETEIKSSYRKLALKWHPDKNLDNSDYAKEQFQIVQQAYEVLSDRQERAWYDAHRDQILRGANSEFQDKSLDVFQYFTTTCFKGYGDDAEGFYTVYRNVFEQIAKEDIDFMDEKEEFCEIPGFGRTDSDYEGVKAFYDYWMSYSTKKSYSWLDPYDIREGKGDRRLLKIIEKENKKVRSKARKERNEEVRNLVAFVRKRDKRVQTFKKEMEAKTLENRKKQEELSKRKRLERRNQHKNEKQADWLKFDNVQSELEEIERHLAQQFGEELSQSDDDERDEEEDFSNLYCVACNKVFKNPNAFENHEVSKKHRENVEKLKQVMLAEEDLESNLTEDMEEYNDVNNQLDDVIDEDNEDISGEESIGDEENLNEICDKECDGSEDEPNKVASKKKRKKKVLSQNSFKESTAADDEEDINVIPIVSDKDDFDFGTSKSQKKKNRRNTTNNNNNKAKVVTVEVQEEEEPVRGPSKKQAKKDKKAAKKNVVEESDIDDFDLSHCCVTCKSNFPSKNKLFEHLKKTGHGVYLPQKTKQASNKKSSSVKN